MQSEIEQVGTSVVVRLIGDLSTETAPRVRTTLLKCLVEQPDAVVVDLSRATVREPVALSVFPAVARQAAMFPGTPILLSVPQPEVSRLFGTGRYGHLAVFASVDDALAADPRRATRSLSDSLLPVSGAIRRARQLAADACSRWEVPQLAQPAVVIANELVTNAVVHAATMIDLRFTLGRRYLTIAVRDGSTAEPRLSADALPDSRTGRGLIIVDAMAARWGSTPADGGKVVWAHLSAHKPLR